MNPPAAKPSFCVRRRCTANIASGSYRFLPDRVKPEKSRNPRYRLISGLLQYFPDTKMAEREGFEPSIQLYTVYPLSRRAPSADSATSPQDMKSAKASLAGFARGVKHNSRSDRAPARSEACGKNVCGRQVCTDEHGPPAAQGTERVRTAGRKNTGFSLMEASRRPPLV